MYGQSCVQRWCYSFANRVTHGCLTMSTAEVQIMPLLIPPSMPSFSYGHWRHPHVRSRITLQDSSQELQFLKKRKKKKITLSLALIFLFTVNFQVFRTNIWLSYLQSPVTSRPLCPTLHATLGTITTQPFDFIQMAAWISLLGTHIYVNAYHFIIDATHLWDYTEHSSLLNSKCYFFCIFSGSPGCCGRFTVKNISTFCLAQLHQWGFNWKCWIVIWLAH